MQPRRSWGQTEIPSTTTRLPIALCLDVSPSMTGAPIAELNAGVKVFYEEVAQDPRSKLSAEVAIITFADQVRVVQEFTMVSERRPPLLKVDVNAGGTSLGSGVRTAAERLERRKQELRSQGTEYYQPWLVIMTDGQPTDDSHLEVAPQVHRLVTAGKLSFLPVGIGSGADLVTLRRFTPDNNAVRLTGLKFREFFRFLSQSVSAVGASRGRLTLSSQLGQVLAANNWGARD